MNLDEGVRGLIAAQQEIDDWDHDFRPAPYERYTEAKNALSSVPEAQRAGVVALLASEDSRVRREAANACAFWCLSSAHGALVAALGDAKEDVRDACGDALVAVGRETALGTLADARAQVSKHVLRRATDAAMEAMGTGVLPLLERLDVAPDSSIAERDAWWKLYLLDQEATSAVLERRIASPNFDWAYGTAALLRALGGGAWVRPAFLKLVHHPDAAIARIAAEVLQRFGDATVIEPLLVSVQTATHPWQQQAALRSVFELAAKSRTPVLARVRPLLRDDESTQEVLMGGLAALAPASWEPYVLTEFLLCAGLRHESEKVVTAALRAALVLRRDSLSVAVEVTATLAHRSWYANEMVAARDAYFEWAEKASASAMVKAVESGMTAGDVRARTLATNSVHRLARTSAGRWQVELYLRALASADEGLRRAAASALAVFERRESAELLLVRAREGSPAEASSMIDALAKLGDARVVDVALSRAADVFAGAPIPDKPEPAWLCNSAVCALGGFLGEARAFEALSRSLKHVEMRMRRDAATVLGKAGDKRAVPLLQPLLQDPNKQVRNAAQTALAALAS